MTVEHMLMGFPIVGFFEFGEVPRGIYDRYKMYYAFKILINGQAFYFHEN